jgi:hypothetical protein
LKLALGAAALGAQDLGHKLPGLIGLDAGRIPEPGLYVIDRVVFYQADELRDRFGNVIPVGPLEFQAIANGAGVSYTKRLPHDGLFFTAAAAAPLARFSLDLHDRPEASFDRFGLTDIFVQPARLGWRHGQVDVVGGYAIYLPTGNFPLAGGKGLSSGNVTHEFSMGGSVFGDNARTVFATALASYNLNLRKRGIDLIRGDTFQVQGGVGVSRLNRTVEAGVAAHVLRQVRPDRGADLPEVLRGARDRVYGVGPEIAVTLKSIRSQIRTRYEWDLGVRSRPKGNVFVVGLVVKATD